MQYLRLLVLQKKIIHCLSDIQIYLGILYFYLLNLMIPHMVKSM